MAFTALGPIAVEMGGWTMKKILPWAIALGVAVILGGAVWIQSVRLDAAQDALQATVRSLKEARDDTGRWRMASEQRDEAIKLLNGAVDRLRADAAWAEQVAANAATANHKIQDDLRQTQATLREKARANPDQAKPIGPLAAAFAGGLQP